MSTSPHPAVERRRVRARWTAVVAALAALSLALALAARRVRAPGGDVAPSPVSAPADVGPGGRCGGCHLAETEAWERSAHARHARPVATPPGGADAAIGSRWMQAYLRRDAEGVHRIVDVCFDRRTSTWRDVREVLVAIAGGDAGLSPASLPPVASRAFDVDCAGCHAAGSVVARDAVDGRLRASWRGLALDCETCHGPVGTHAGGAPGTAVRLGALTPRAQVMVCGRCHGGPAAEGDPRPADLADAVAHVDDHLGLFPDGTPAAQTYQLASFVRSPCFTVGGLVCTACHDPHGAPPGREPHPRDRLAAVDATCLSCHAGYAGRAHTHHAPGTEASRCVSCHMPRLLSGLLAHQHDHGLSVPVPGIPGTRDACSACHAEWAPAVLRDAWVERWGEVPGHRDEGPRVVAALRRGETVTPAALRRLLEAPDPYLRAVAARALGDEGAPAVRDDPSPEVRSAVVRGLVARREGDLVAGLTPFLRDPAARVRAEAAVGLLLLGDARATPFLPEVEALVRGEREHADARRALAWARLAEGRPLDAVALAEGALAFAPRAPDLWFLAGEAYRRAGRGRAAQAAMQRGLSFFSGAEGGGAALGELERFVASWIDLGHPQAAAALLDAAATHLPAAEDRARFRAMAERLAATAPRR